MTVNFEVGSINFSMQVLHCNSWASMSSKQVPSAGHVGAKVVTGFAGAWVVVVSPPPALFVGGREVVRVRTPLSPPDLIRN